MKPEELYHLAGDVILACNPSGVTDATAQKFIERLKDQIRSIGGWLAPVLGEEGYGDGQVIDQLRQVKFQTERVLTNFPMGVEALSIALQGFRTFLKGNYNVNSQGLHETNQ